MDRKAELEARLASLRAELETVDGGPTEVYSRIVGYYRSVRNWNAGKREEYHARLTYGMPAQPKEQPVFEMPVTASLPAASYSPEKVTRPTASTVQAAAVVPGTVLRQAAQAALELELGGEAAAASRAGFLVFTKKACPNCPPVADYVAKAGLSAIFVDVDGEEGLALARRHGILATPTVLGLDGEGREAFRACGLGELKASLVARV